MRVLFSQFLMLVSLLHAGDLKHATPATYRQLLGTLKAGDTLELAAGVYERGLPVVGCHGAQGAWITIQGPAEGMAEIRQTQVANCVELEQSWFVALKRLSILGDGRKGIPGLFGISAKGGLKNRVHHVLIEDCIISGWNTSQQAVGISTKTPTWDWTIRRNVIRDCGTGLYLGNSNGHDPFIRGVIENNLVENPIGYCMEIKYQNPRPELAGIPTTASRTIIRHNVFIKSDAPSPDGDRPSLLVGGFPSSGPGSSDMYEIHGNFFWQNPRESLLQASGRVSIHDNVFHGCPSHAAITLRDHDLPLKLARIYNNTIYAVACGIRVASRAPDGHGITGNAIFASADALSLHGSITNVSANLVGEVSAASQYLADPEGMDFHPRPGSCEGELLQMLTFQDDTAVDKDFDGRSKGDGRFRGAFAGPAQPGAWRLQRALKP